MAEDSGFAQRIRDFRTHRGMSQEQLADLVQVSVMTVRRWEWEQRVPRLEEIKRLAEALGVTVEELLNGPRNDKVKVVLTWDWQKYEEGGIDMTGNEFDVFLGKGGEIGLKGSGLLTSREAVEEFLANIRLQVESAFEAQLKRGAISEA